MTLVYDAQRAGEPSTHALVIGVGTYPRLLGGAAPRGRELTEGMGQLQSPPRSAKAFADWLITAHSDPLARLATVDLLLSQGDIPAIYVRPDTEVEIAVDLAVKDAIAASIRAWKARGNENPANTLHFYFCGHGVGRGFELALLARDFGEDDELPFHNNAIWLEGLKEGMKSCAATRQLYFADACRVGSERLRESYTEGLDPVVAVRKTPTPGMRQAIYYATTSGEPAFGRPGMPSLFTEYLIKGLNGLGANDDRGPWTIETTKLQRVLTELADDFASPEYKGLQAPTTGEQVSFNIHRLAQPPVVPLYLDASWREDDEEPPADLLLVGVDSEGQSVLRWPRPWHADPLCSWEAGMFRSDQAAGLRYSWNVKFMDGREMRSDPRTLNPPFRIVEFPRDGVA